MNRNTRDLEQPRIINRGGRDCLANTPGAALYSAEDSIQESNLACGQEQLEYQYRPMTPGEEEISRIYEDEIYHPPDMIEKPVDLWIARFNMRPGENCSLQTAPSNQLWKRYSRTKFSSSSISDSRVSFNSRSSLDNWGSILCNSRRYGRCYWRATSYSWSTATLVKGWYILTDKPGTRTVKLRTSWLRLWGLHIGSISRLEPGLRERRV